MPLGGDGRRFDPAQIADVAAAVDRRVAIEHFLPRPADGHTQAVVVPRDRREVAHHEHDILRLLAAAQERDHGVLPVLVVDPGETAQQIQLRNRNQILPLDFTIRCDDFKVSFYPSGLPEEWRASLSIIEQGNVVKSQDVIVNDPLHYKGISIFQASYGRLPSRQQDIQLPEELTLVFTSKATKMIYEQKATIGQTIKLPEGLGKFVP